MRTVDRIRVHAPFSRVFAVASSVARWPAILPHYRWVRFLDGGLVEMAAWRPFGALKYPTWWVSEMTVDRPAGEIRYRHVRGITRGMQVAWRSVEVLKGTWRWKSCTRGMVHVGRWSAALPRISSLVQCSFAASPRGHWLESNALPKERHERFA